MSYQEAKDEVHEKYGLYNHVIILGDEKDFEIYPEPNSIYEQADCDFLKAEILARM